MCVYIHSYTITIFISIYGCYIFSVDMSLFWTGNVDEKSVTDAVYLDFCKAFGVV